MAAGAVATSRIDEGSRRKAATHAAVTARITAPAIRADSSMLGVTSAIVTSTAPTEAPAMVRPRRLRTRPGASRVAAEASSDQPAPSTQRPFRVGSVSA